MTGLAHQPVCTLRRHACGIAEGAPAALDEPTSGMDPAGRDAMLDLLLRLGRDHGKAILLSTHLLGDIERVCDAVVILHEGRVLCQGPVHELCRRRHNRARSD